MTDAKIQLPGLNKPVDDMPDDGRFPTLLADEDWKANTLLRAEVCMLRMVEELTNKPEWWRKVHDPDVAKRWRQEALDMDWRAHLPFVNFTPRMADACIAELRKKARLYEETGLIPVMDYSACVIKSDSLLDPDRDSDLLASLKTAVARLEDVPGDQKDWHPRTNQQVLDLVHPSLYPLVYGRTRVLTDRRINLANALDHCGAGTVIPSQEGTKSKPVRPSPFLSRRFQWLPCDVKLDPAAGRATIDSYINNLHPADHADLYPVIERFIEKALPAWDLIYRWPEKFPFCRMDCSSVIPECKARECRVGSYAECSMTNRPVDDDEEPREEDEEWDDAYEGSERYTRDTEWYDLTHPLEIPDPSPTADYFVVQPSDVKATGGYFDAAERIQVIVKLANIHLTPENPSYEGGTWHVEGQLNEHICATALFYYDSDNITDCHLDLRTPADREELVMELGYEQGDYRNIERAFAIDPHGDTIQDVGSVLTRPNRALFFPNIYLHHVSPFCLVDPSRPGHRKILALFLVDPAVPVISTTNVPPQQRHWWERQVDLRHTRIGDLPAELRNIVLGEEGLPMDEVEAKRLREELMDERSVLQRQGEGSMRGQQWNFCEH